ncbi:MAG: amidohydrolase family protein [Planctomycetes bacterium]|nr:amidohydrolase family protein [Planctomycetota bacterium]
MSSSGTAGPPLADAHCHVVTRALADPGPTPLLVALDRSGTTHACCLGLPFDLEVYQPPRYTSLADEAVARTVAAAPGRLVPFTCGFDPRERGSLATVERRLADGFRGVGELLLRYDGDLGMELRQPVDDPHLLELYRLAGRAGVPVLFHATVKYAREIDRALAASPDTDFLWAHCGVSWEVSSDTSGLVRSLVARYLRLHADISWILWDFQLWDRARGALRESWLDLFREYPDRFLVGYDLVGEYGEMPQTAARYQYLLARLAPDVARSIGSGNFHRLCGTRPITAAP